MEIVQSQMNKTPKITYHSQADPLEGELDDYLAAPTKYTNVVEFWEVCISFSLLRSADIV